MKLKKLASNLLIVSMLVVSLVGCSQTSEEDKIGGADAPAAEQEKDNSEEEKADKEDESDEESSEATADIKDFTVSLESDETIELTKEVFDEVGTTEAEATIQKKNKGPETNKWTGYVLKDVLEKNGVTEYTSLSVEAADGFASDYTKEMIDAGVMVGVLMDGQALEDDEYPKLVVDGEGGNMWIKGVSKIVVNK